MFSISHQHELLNSCILSHTAYHPFPTADDRPAWEALPEAVRAYAIAQGEQYLDAPWPALPATLYMEFVRNGNRSRFEAPHFARRRMLGALALAECVEGRGRFLDAVINGIWHLCEETTWVLPAHNDTPPYHRHDPLHNPTNTIIDLFSAETGALLAWTHYLLRARLDMETPLISARIRHEVTQRLIDPFLTHEDYWWMGLSHAVRVNNWNPWCTSNCLAAGALLEEEPARRVAVVEKGLRLLDRFIDAYDADGGCDEGPSYWAVAGGSLFDCLEILLSLSDGKLDYYAEPLIGEIGRFMARVHIAGDYFINFADGGARVTAPADLIYRYGKCIGDEQLSALGAALHRQQDEPLKTDFYPMLRVLQGAFNYTEITGADAPFTPARDVWLPGTQIMVAREQAATDGLYLAAKGGHNAESHNHNDIGQFIVYLDGRPVLADAGVETYTAKTFSAQRYELWTMQSAYHNLPTVNGVQQQAGSEYAAREVAYRCAEESAELSLDIAGAYPDTASITRWQRACRLQRGASPVVEIVDEFTLRAPSDNLALSLLTPCEVSLETPGVLRLREPVAGEVQVAYAADRFTASVERLPIDDARLIPVWGDHLNRIVLQTTAATAGDTWVLRIFR